SVWTVTIGQGGTGGVVGSDGGNGGTTTFSGSQTISAFGGGCGNGTSLPGPHGGAGGGNGSSANTTTPGTAGFGFAGATESNIGNFNGLFYAGSGGGFEDQNGALMFGRGLGGTTVPVSQLSGGGGAG